jgi:hypothetical protein
MDGVHPQHNSVAACGWIKLGTTKTLESNTGRKRVNINGAVNIDQLRVVSEFDERVGYKNSSQHKFLSQRRMYFTSP